MTQDEEKKMLQECIEFNRCDQIVEKYWNLVCYIVRKTFILKNAPMIREQLEEVYQEVFFQLLDDNRRRLRLYQEAEGHSLSRWIVVIANRTTLNFLRQKGFDSLMWQNKKDVLSDHFKSSINLETDIVDKVTAEVAIQMIPQNDRIILKLYRYGMSSKEIADIMESTEAAINNKISRIKKTLNEFVESGSGT